MALGEGKPRLLTRPLPLDEDEPGPVGPTPLSLPPDLLTLIVSKVQAKDSLRRTCRCLRLTVDACTTLLTWRGGSDPGAAAAPLSLAAALPALCSGISMLECSDMNKSLASLMGCPITLRKLICNGTSIADLTPLAACTGLCELSCNGTSIADLTPLAACTGLCELSCNRTGVVDLSPLVACTSLQVLACNYCRVTDLGPLAACLELQTLHCSSTQVADLGPLAACTKLQALRCYRCQVVDVGPLAACMGLVELWCDGCVPDEQTQILRARASVHLYF